MMPDHARFRRWTAEAVGTFFLVLVGPGAAAVNASTHGAIGVTGIALAFALVISAMVFATGRVSGAHMNPAVTLAFWRIGRFPAREVIPYLAAQCAGGTAAAFLLRIAVGAAVAGAATRPVVAPMTALALEAVMSFALMFVIMAVATDPRMESGGAALAVGATVGAFALMGGPLTGASMNPARSLAPALASGIWTSHWIYWAGPIVGTTTGGAVWRALSSAASAPASDLMGVEGQIVAD